MKCRQNGNLSFVENFYVVPQIWSPEYLNFKYPYKFNVPAMKKIFQNLVVLL